MNVAAVLTLLLVNVHLSWSCFAEKQVLICSNLPSAFQSGYSSLVMFLPDVGEINATALRDDNLISVTRLRMENAGVTAVAEEAFSSLQNLTDLSLDGNLLTDINPKWFGRPEVLSELSLAENRIEALSVFALSGLINLRRLTLNKNRIRTIDPDTFSNQTALAELDLSENRMTRVSPQVFKSLTSTKIRLDGNPWDCSCGVQDFVDVLKDLKSKGLLDRQEEVTCESPPSLRGRPVWNVSICVTSPPPLAPSATRTDRPKPTNVLTTASPSPENHVMSSSSSPYVTPVSARSDSPTYSPSTPTGMTGTCVTLRPSWGTNHACTLALVIVVLGSVFSVLCFLGLLHCKIRNKKTVTPEHPNADISESKEGSSRLSQSSHTLKHMEKRANSLRDSPVGWRRSGTGVRSVQSADAVLFTSPFCGTVREQATPQTETEAQSRDAEKQTEGKQEVELERGPVRWPDGSATSAPDGKNLDKDPPCSAANADALPYLSIIKDSADGPCQRSELGMVMGRVSTWPPTVRQWQMRQKKMEEGEGPDVFTVWTAGFPGQLKKVDRRECLPESNQDEEETKKKQIEDPSRIKDAQMTVGSFQTPKPDDETTSVSDTMHEEEELKRKPETSRQIISKTKDVNTCELGEIQDPKPPEPGSGKTESCDEAKQATATGRRSTPGSKTPDDETLLFGNEYVFVDLLHEVVQNNGRWTRERWKQKHGNKQRR